jgi:signal transduction histidine kinase
MNISKEEFEKIRWVINEDKRLKEEEEEIERMNRRANAEPYMPISWVVVWFILAIIIIIFLELTLGKGFGLKK